MPVRYRPHGPRRVRLSTFSQGLWSANQLDAVEYARSVLCAHSFIESRLAREVHILRMRRAFERGGLLKSLGYALWVLELLREVERLGNGYWIPTPSRLVSLGQTGLLISANPTTELRRHVDVQVAGHARCYHVRPSIELPTQALNAWLGLEEASAPAWAAALIERYKTEVGPTIAENTEFFAVEDKDAATTRAVWGRDAAQAVVYKDMALCRARLSDRSSRYFLGLIRRGRVVGEAAIQGDILRLQYGMAKLVGRPLVVVIASGPTSTFKFLSPLPRPQRRLLFAVGRRIEKFSKSPFAVRLAEHASALTNVLEQLGCEVKYASA